MDNINGKVNAKRKSLIDSIITDINSTIGKIINALHPGDTPETQSGGGRDNDILAEAKASLQNSKILQSRLQRLQHIIDSTQMEALKKAIEALEAKIADLEEKIAAEAQTPGDQNPSWVGAFFGKGSRQITTTKQPLPPKETPKNRVIIAWKRKETTESEAPKPAEAPATPTTATPATATPAQEPKPQEPEFYIYINRENPILPEGPQEPKEIAKSIIESEDQEFKPLNAGFFTRGSLFLAVVDNDKVKDKKPPIHVVKKDLTGFPPGTNTEYWVPLIEYRKWLNGDGSEKGTPQLRADLDLAIAALRLTEKMYEEEPVPELPDWVEKMLGPEEGSCVGQGFLPSDCIKEKLRRDIRASQIYTQQWGLKAKDSRVEEAKDLQKELDDLQKQKGGGPTAAALEGLQKKTKEAERATRKKEEEKIRQMMATRYPDRAIRVRGENGQNTTMYVRNPYLAYEHRHKVVKDYKNPPEKDALAKMNTNVLKALVPEMIIEDHAMSTAFLESLWHCGNNPDLSSDPRCYPAKVIGEIREFQVNENQEGVALAAQRDIQDWQLIKRMLRALKNALPGMDITATNDALPGPPGPPEPKPPVPPPPVPNPITRAHSATQLVTVTQLGGGNLKPFLPTSLGGLGLTN